MLAPFPNHSAAELEAHLAEMDEHGITIVAEVLSAAELAYLPDLIDRLMAVRELHPGQTPESVRNFNMCTNLVNHAPLFAELCLRPAVFSIMQHLLGPDAVLSTIAALEPRPGATGADGGQVQSLHRDGLGGGRAAEGLQGCQSLWLLDPMEPQNGATRFGLGTHQLAIPPDLSADDWVRDQGHLVQYSLPAGCAVVYDARTLHAMSTNHSGRRRRALACFYTQPGLPRMCDQRHYLTPEVQAQVSPAARRLLGLDAPEPLSARGRFYPDGELPTTHIEAPKEP